MGRYRIYYKENDELAYSTNDIDLAKEECASGHFYCDDLYI